MRPLTHLIILTYNGRHHLETCLPSVEALKYENLHVVVLDNGSTDGSADYVRDRHPAISVVRSELNLGFCAGNNLAMQAAIDADADYVVLLNDDTRVRPDWLDILVDAMEAHPDAALADSTQLDWDGGVCLRYHLQPAWLEGKIERLLPDADEPIRSAPYATGCCMIARARALEKIGLFDPEYFAYVEDVDLSLRAWLAGFRVLHVPEAIIWHRVGGSSAARQQMIWGYRNQLYTMLKIYELSTLRHFAQAILARWIFTRNRCAWWGTLWVLVHVGRLLADRRQVQALRSRSDREIFALAGLPWS